MMVWHILVALDEEDFGGESQGGAPGEAGEDGNE